MSERVDCPTCTGPNRTPDCPTCGGTPNMVSDLRQEFFADLDAWCVARGLSISTVSNRVFNDTEALACMRRRIGKDAVRMAMVRNFMRSNTRAPRSASAGHPPASHKGQTAPAGES